MQNRGIDWLGITSRHSNSRTAAKHFPKGAALGFMTDAFNMNPTDLRKPRRILATGKVSEMRVHLLNTTAVRWGRFGKADALKEFGSLRALKKAIMNSDTRLLEMLDVRYQAVKKLAEEFDVPLLVSPFLEHDFLGRDGSKVMRKLHKDFGFDLNNPVRGMQKGPWKYNEKHGKRVPTRRDVPDYYSSDGQDILFIEWGPQAMKSAQGIKVYGWGHPFNGRDPKQFTPPLERRMFPSEELTKIMYAMCTGTLVNGGRRAFKGDVITIGRRTKQPFLHKPNDDHNEHIVVLIPSRAKSIVALDANKNELGLLSGHGKWDEDPSLYRFYSAKQRGGSGEAGYQLAAKAMKNTGRPDIYYRAGNRVYHVRNPIYRWGPEYRVPR